MSEYKTVNKNYTVEEYDSAWPEKFEVLKKSLVKIFGNKAIQIEHVGSTSIVGMKAKPIIDVMVVVPDVKDLLKERQQMEQEGYLYRENYITDNSFFFCRELDGERIENIHVFPVGHTRIVEFIEKRDYFRLHPDEAQRYKEIKVALAKQFPNDYISYRKGKDAYLNVELVEKIKHWEQQS